MGNKTKVNKPSKLSITRDNTTFTFSWTNPAKATTAKKAPAYSKVYARYRTASGRNSKGGIAWSGYTNFTGVPASKGTHSKSKMLANTVRWIEFQVKGEWKVGKKKKTKNTGWKSVQWSASPPTTAEELSPDLEVVEYNESQINRSEFKWTVDGASHTTKAWCTYLEFATAWTDESKGDNPDAKNFPFTTFKLSRNAGTGIESSTGGHYDIDDENASGSIYWLESGYSVPHIRWLKVRAGGPGGVSRWTDTEYVAYCDAEEPSVVTPTAEYDNDTGGIDVSASWLTKDDNSKYTQTTTTALEYVITTPTARLQCTASEGTIVCSSGNTVITSNNSQANNGAKFEIPTQLGANQALFLRTVSTYNSSTTKSPWQLLTDLPMYLADPQFTATPDPDLDQHLVDISAANNSTDIAKTNTDLGAFVVIYFKKDDSEEPIPIGILKQPETTIEVGFPDVDDSEYYGFGLQTMVIIGWNPDAPGNKTPFYKEGTSTVQYYKYNLPSGDTYSDLPILKSTDIIWRGGDIPKAPTGVKAVSTPNDSIQVSWNWDWGRANYADISWSDHKDAWESTDEPSVYRIKAIHASRWNIANLDKGKTWYIRVRLVKVVDDIETVGPWSSISSDTTLNLVSAPDIPDFKLSKSVVSLNDKITATWSYSSNDTTPQKNAQIEIVTFDEEGEKHYAGDDGIVAKIEGEAQRVEIDIKKVADFLGWEVGNTYSMAIKTTSESNKTSDYSTIQTIRIADPPTIEVSLPTVNSTLVYEEVEKELDNGANPSTTIAQTELHLKEYPLKLLVTGAGDSGTTTVVIRRYISFESERPDESDYTGYAEETVCYYTQVGEAAIELDKGQFSTHLDDEAWYYIEASVADTVGQYDVDRSLVFKVAWADQATIPLVTAVANQTELVSFITPVSPVSPLPAGAVCDIYRLSSDKPQLIVQNGQFDQTYVDPYPAIGPDGGHRVVYKTANGDYIDSDGYYAWTDTDVDVFDPDEEYEVGDRVIYDKVPYICIEDHADDVFNKSKWSVDWNCDYIKSIYTIIDFDSEQIQLLYNIDLSNSWKKDFQETRYLGGHIQGDWNPGVSRTATISTVSIITEDADTIAGLRRLADYAGVCHIRTSDGSSFAADIQVSETRNYSSYDTASYSLSITRVDNESLDGMTLDEWNGV